MDAQRVIVRVKWGPESGRTAVLRPGDALRVGRSERATLVIPSDSRMSALHFELAWDGARVSFRDLRSATGTLVNGEAGRAEGEIPHGGWLGAGDTIFTVHLEGKTPPRREDDDDDAPVGQTANFEERRKARAAAREALSVARERALSVLGELAAREPLHAVLDAARDRRILEVLRESVEEHRSLYDGVAGEALAHVAPYLVRLPPGSRLLSVLVREGWGRRWGVYVTSKLPFREVRRHFRRFLMVEAEPTGKSMYFRYYDPEVMTTFLAHCTPQQRGEIFASLGHVVAEGNGFACGVHRPDGREP